MLRTREVTRGDDEQLGGMTTRILAVGMLLSGLFAYVFFLTATRTLGDEGGAALAVLWAYWNMAAAFLSFPLQHWIDRTCAAEGHGGSVRAALPQIAAVVGLISVASGVGAWLLHDQLFGSASAGYPIALGAVTAGLGLGGVVRGLLASTGRHRAVVGELIAENLARAVSALAIAGLGWSPDLFAWALAAGALVSLLPIGDARFEGPVVEARGSVLGFLGDIAGASLLSQLVLTGSPIILQLMGASPGVVTATFSALAIARVPYLVALGVVTQLTSVLTGWYLDARLDLLRRARMTTAGLTLAAASVAAPVAAWLGNDVLRLIYDLDTQLSDGSLASIGAGTCLAIGNLVLGLVLVARGVGRPVVVAWLVGIAAFACSTVVLGGEPLATRVLTSFAVAELTTLLALTAGDAVVGRSPATTRR